MASAIILESGELVETNKPPVNQTTINPDSVCGRLAQELEQLNQQPQPDEEV